MGRGRFAGVSGQKHLQSCGKSSVAAASRRKRRLGRCSSDGGLSGWTEAHSDGGGLSSYGGYRGLLFFAPIFFGNSFSQADRSYREPAPAADSVFEKNISFPMTTRASFGNKRMRIKPIGKKASTERLRARYKGSRRHQEQKNS